MKKMKLAKTSIIFMFVLMVTVAFFGCSTSMEYINQGDVVEGKHYELVIDKIEVTDAVQFINPAEGNVFVAVKFHYKNITEESVEYKELPTITLHHQKMKKNTKSTMMRQYLCHHRRRGLFYNDRTAGSGANTHGRRSIRSVQGRCRSGNA